jgi:signal peptidase II
MLKNLHWLWLSALIVLLDQISKIMIIQRFAYGEGVAVLPSFNFVHHINKGAAFSIGHTVVPPWAFSALGIGAALWIAYWLFKEAHTQKLVALALACVAGGAIGNVIDRIVLGHVTDFIDFYVGTWHFATFNVADIAISTGAGLMLLDGFLQWRKSRTEV